MRTKSVNPESFDSFTNGPLDPGRRSLIHKVDIKAKKIFFTPASKECEFLQFINNTSDFWSYQHHNQEFSGDVESWWYSCILNKLTAIGYLLRKEYQLPLRRIVLAYDEYGPKGPSGKSLFAKAISYAVPQVMWHRGSLRNWSPYDLEDVSEHTRNLLIDDLPVDLRFSVLKNRMAGDLRVNRRCKPPLAIHYAKAPRILAMTNLQPHQIKIAPRNRGSFVEVPFSDWYNDKHHPVDDFGHALFLSWGERQWNLFDNLMADCVLLHTISLENKWAQNTSGIVPAQILPF